jgi:hypothetical protein
MFLLIVLWSVRANALENDQSETCISVSSPTWTRQEAWVWEQLCSSRSADLNHARIFGGRPRVDEPKTWSPERILRPRFLEAILTEDRYSKSLPDRSIIISGAWFHNLIDLEGSSLSIAIYLRDSRFDAPVVLRDTHISGTVGLDGSDFNDVLNLERTRVAGSLSLRHASFRRINLAGAKVDGDLVVGGSTSQGTLNVNDARIHGRFYLSDGNKFEDVNGKNMTVAGDVVASRADFRRLKLEGAKVGGDIYLNKGTFRSVNLTRIKVAGNLDATKSAFQGEFNLFNAQIKGSVLLFKSIFTSRVVCSGATVGGILSLSKDHEIATWQESAEIDLGGSTIKGIEDTPDAWPSHVRLGGLIIEQPQAQATDGDQGFAERKVSWYANNWLGREEAFSRGSYMQLESLLRRAGRDGAADAIAIRRIDHEYRQQPEFRRALGFFHRNVSGYGYKPERALLLAVALVMIGAMVARRIPRSALNDGGITSLTVFSLQRLTPAIDFGKAYRDFDLANDDIPEFVRSYFYLHAGLGWIIFVILLGDVAGGA